ncbi:MAG: hypothetical protein IPQ15_05505 [Betaproteobacteria bacterium]|nr:hypothetical protein [Betaproteobacteria bacterium]
MPIPALRRGLARVALLIAESWIARNSGWMTLTQRTHRDVEGLGADYRSSWYLVSCNHQSGRHPGAAAPPQPPHPAAQVLPQAPADLGAGDRARGWALEFLFMRRHSEEFPRRHPEMRGKDQETSTRGLRAVRADPDQR